VRPPLTKRLRPGHWVTFDYVVAAVCAISVFREVRRAEVFSVLATPWIFGAPLPLLLALGIFLPIALRRRSPLVAYALLLAGAAVIMAVDAKANPVALLPAAYVLYLVAATQSRKTGINALTAALALIAGLLLTDRVVRPAGGTLGAGVSVALAMIIAWSTGNAVRQRRAYANKLQEQATNSAVAEERLRIARELHDVVAHSMSVIAVQAGYGAYVIDGQPDDARAALGAIQATSRDALDEMRRMLGVLRQQDYGQAGQEEPTDGTGPSGTGLGAIGLGEVEAGLAGADIGARFGAGASGGTDSVEFSSGKFRAARTGSPVETGRGSAGVVAGGSAGVSSGAGRRRGPQAPLAPAPGLADLDRLIARTGGVGIHVDVQRLGCPREIPAGVDLSAYRIVQEALTNVVKHASTDACRVVVDYGEDVLSIEVTNGGPGAMPDAHGSLDTDGAGANGTVSEGAAGGIGGVRAAGGMRGMGGGGGRLADSRGNRACLGPGSTRARFMPPPTGGGGHGIIGMRERVGLCSGQFSAGPLPDGGFRVAAQLPLGDAPSTMVRDAARNLARDTATLIAGDEARAATVNAAPPTAAHIFQTATVSITPAEPGEVAHTPAAVGVPTGGYGGKPERPTADLPS
jgi:signal transduction histidine kinase